MKTRSKALVSIGMTAVLGMVALAQEPARNPLPPGTQAPPAAAPATPPPTEPPPPPPTTLPKPPSEQPPGVHQQKPAADGQWVYTTQYGWVWMPYGDRYTHLPPDGAPPNMYVYYPEAGWCWVVAPWLWGWGPVPFFGHFGPRYFSWYGVGLGHWYGFGDPYFHWGWQGRAYWGGGRWNGVTHFYDGPGPGRSPRGGVRVPRELGPGWGRGLRR